MGLNVARFEGVPDDGFFKKIKTEYGRSNIFLFHCAWDRLPKELEEGNIEDPNVRAAKVGLKLDLNIGIHNGVHLTRPLEGEYDLRIHNTFSTEKKL